MTALLQGNWGDLLVLALVAAAAAAVIRSWWRSRKNGRSGCGCGCGGCPSRGICHPVPFPREEKEPKESQTRELEIRCQRNSVKR